MQLHQHRPSSRWPTTHKVTGHESELLHNTSVINRRASLGLSVTGPSLGLLASNLHVLSVVSVGPALHTKYGGKGGAKVGIQFL
jgi:hypothetical protein